MSVRLYLLPPTFLIVAAMMRPTAEPVRAPRVKSPPPPTVSVEPEPTTAPTVDLSRLHRDIDHGCFFIPEPALSDPDDPDIQAILRKLETMIVDLRFDSTTLDDVLSYLRDFSGLNIVMDARDGSPLRPDPRMSVRTRDLVLKDVLEFVLSLQGMVYRVTDEKVVLVCTRVDPDRY